ncbi:MULTISPECIES: NAD-dependent epimerase/dehydratase family protein [unclassified Methylobacterium]|uniref:NAD-dependent epimerase/dehydratase family protein n=1 Tax=unclassified Methylobacterium TaxID=2615210 RepID=UPI00223EFB62|nr:MULTISPECIES: NAD-dependent epimerase/dehydratase family protein [Methylobacterium]WFT77683.1 GDP-mannose 4,6-dehydratase [Methylobacterium nodulans]
MSFWSGKRVLVTGSAGFLGSWTVRTLRESGALVVGYVRDLNAYGNSLADDLAKPTIVVHGRLEDRETLRRAVNEHEVDTVIHLAAQPIVGTALRDPVGTFEANIRGTWNLLDACRLYGKVERILVASSDKSYGSSDVLPYTEDMPLVGRAPYDVSKSCTDLLARSYFETYGLPICITRAGNFFGGGDLNFNRLVPGTIRWALRGERPVLRSDGTMIRDYIYVRDVVAGYLAIGEAMHEPGVAGEAFNLSNETPLSTMAFTHEILRACRRPDLEPLVLGEARSEIDAQHLSAAKVRRIVGWSPRWSMADALAETVAWYRNYMGRIGEIEREAPPHDGLRQRDPQRLPAPGSRTAGPGRGPVGDRRPAPQRRESPADRRLVAAVEHGGRPGGNRRLAPELHRPDR